MKAIETYYRGYRFRSRLEARYAVFFDALGNPWEYEPEGFELADGTHYLPDFWLPVQRCYLEIKGAYPSDREQEICNQFRDQGGRAIVLCHGLPAEHMGTLYCWDVGESAGCSEWDCRWAIEPNGHQVCLYAYGNPDSRELFFDGEYMDRRDLGFGLTHVPEIGEAQEQAKSARFEHGESPIVIPVESFTARRYVESLRPDYDPDNLPF